MGTMVWLAVAPVVSTLISSRTMFASFAFSQVLPTANIRTACVLSSVQELYTFGPAQGASNLKQCISNGGTVIGYV
jgi:hypothetical protein